MVGKISSKTLNYIKTNPSIFYMLETHQMRKTTEFVDILKINNDQSQSSKTLPHFPMFTLYITVSSGKLALVGSQGFTGSEESLRPWAGSAGLSPALTSLKLSLPASQKILSSQKTWLANNWLLL